MVSVGISDIAFSSGSNVLDLNELAQRHGVDVQKYYAGIGQQKMSIPSVDEDIVTMGANAAKRIIDRHGAEGIHTLLFATETGIDQSKAAGVYVHKLIGLSNNCRVVELKQACYSATAGLQMAAGIVARDPKQKVLVIASDVARYEQDSSGEPTQGAGAVAILITANPTVLEFDAASGLYTDEIMDFWRPNYSSTAFVDGKYSIKAYLTAVEESWKDYLNNGGSPFSDFDYFCYHQPFTKMAIKAHTHLNKVNDSPLDAEAVKAQIEPTFGYNRVVGNSYTASIYFGLIALLDFSVTENIDLAGKRIGFLSYGSGSVAEFFSGTVVAGYQQQSRTEENQQLLDSRREIAYPEYHRLYNYPYPQDGSSIELASETLGTFRLARVSDHMRIYEQQDQAAV